MAALFPIVLLLVDGWLFTRPDEKFSLAEILKDKIVFLILSVIAAIIAMLAAAGGRINVVAELSLLERMLLPFYIVFFYIRKTIVPTSLSPIYPELDSLWLYLSAVFVIGITWGCFVLMKKRKYAIPITFISYVIFLLPIIAGLSSGLQPLADRYSYLATLSIFLLVGAGVELLWRSSAESGAKKYRRRILFAVLLVLCGVSSYRTLRHTGVWENSVSLWTQAVRYVPASREEFESRKPYMKPNHLDALINLGTAYYAQQKNEKAIEQFRRVLSLDEHSADAHYNLGNLLFEKGDVRGSLTSFKNAIVADSTYAKAYYNIGIILMKSDSVNGAVAAFQKAARLGFVDAQQLLSQRGYSW
jgi:tetratricopeptide (TPR) repeat protein